MGEEEWALFTRRLRCSECPSGLTCLTSFMLQCHVVLSWFLPLSLFTLFSLSLSNQFLFSFLPPKSSLDFPWWLPAIWFLVNLEFWGTEMRGSKFFLLQFLLRKSQHSLCCLTLTLDSSPSLPQLFSPSLLLKQSVVFLLFLLHAWFLAFPWRALLPALTVFYPVVSFLLVEHQPSFPAVVFLFTLLLPECSSL